MSHFSQLISVLNHDESLSSQIIAFLKIKLSECKVSEQESATDTKDNVPL